MDLLLNTDALNITKWYYIDVKYIVFNTMMPVSKQRIQTS